MLSGSGFPTHHKFTLSLNDKTAVIFSEHIQSILAEIGHIHVQFDGTFYTVTVQFYQLWTIFVSIDRYTLPAIHYLMASKNQELYTAIFGSIRTNILKFNPTTAISDWEPASRKAFKEIYSMAKLSGCWFNFTKRIWAKTQKLGLTKRFRENNEIANFVRQLMAIPFLPAELISPIFLILPNRSFLLANLRNCMVLLNTSENDGFVKLNLRNSQYMMLKPRQIMVQKAIMLNKINHQEPSSKNLELFDNLE